MLARALIVLLLVLNGGVATWWALRPTASPPERVDVPTGVPRLQLLREVPAIASASLKLTGIPTASTPAAAQIAPSVAVPPETPARCLSFGPFVDGSALAVARAALQPTVAALRVREAAAVTARGWRVWVAPLADRTAAQAMAQRIVAAGFQDYYVVPTGDEANSIALGRYGNEGTARHRQSTLQTAGFPAQAEALGGTPAGSWLDVQTPTGTFDAYSVRRRIGAPQVRPLDCAKLR